MASQQPLPHWNQETRSDDNPGTANSLSINDRDWDALFDAVRQRLTDSVSQLSAGRSVEFGAASYVPRTTFTMLSLRVQVLDCVESLAKLHAALRVKHARESKSSQTESEPISTETRQ